MQSYNNFTENLTRVGEISAYSLLKLNLNQVKLMSACDLTIEDVRYVPMFEEYLSMRNDGCKVTHIIAHLAEEYNISESTVKRVVKRLSRRVTV